MKKKIAVFLTSILFGLAGIFVPIFSHTKARAVTTADTTSYVSVGELWDDTNKKMSFSNVSLLFDYVSGINSAQFNTIESLAKDALTSKGMREKSLVKNGTTLKETGKDIVVTLGGLKWQVVYLSTTKKGEPILTLFLADSSQTNVKGYYNTWRSPNTPNAEVNNISSLYSTSYVRTYSLNMGGIRVTGNDTQENVEQNPSSVFAPFTMSVIGDYNDITDFITTPSEVSWQENQRMQDYGLSYNGQTYNLSNEAWSNSLSDDGFFSADRNFAHEPYNNVWKDDYIWLPSYTELGGNQVEKGVWELSAEQRKDSAGNSGNTTAYYTRTCDVKEYTLSAVLTILQSGGTYDPYVDQYNTNIVKPALHLNLLEVMKCIERENGDVVYLDPVNGSDSNSNKLELGYNSLLAVKTIDKAEELVANNGEIVVMNTITLLTDKVLGENKTYTLKRYYGGSNKNFVGTLIEAGKFVADGSADNVRVKLTVKNVTIDSNRNNTYSGRLSTPINAINADVYLEENSIICNNKDSSALTLLNDTTLTMNGGSLIDNRNDYANGSGIFAKTTGDIVINDCYIVGHFTNYGGCVIFTDGAVNNITINGGKIGDWIDANKDGIVDSGEALINTANNYNAIIYARSSNITINDIDFRHNQLGGEGSSGELGLIGGETITINGGLFINNKSIQNQGTQEAGALFRTGKLEINGGVFENNTSNRLAGAVVVYSDSKAIIKNATFKNNTALVGGAIYVNKNATAVIENCEFIGNSATGTWATTNTSNEAANVSGGGAICVSYGANTTIKNCEFTSNTANASGGAIKVFGNTKIYDSLFELNSTTSGGNGGAVSGNLAQIYNTNFIQNTASGGGGAIESGTAYNCYFERNSAGSSGAVYMGRYENCEFIENSSTSHGGASHAASFYNCYFEGNTSTNGGALSHINTVENCEFVGNSATNNGGAICIKEESWWTTGGNIINCTFENNFAGNNGGAIYADLDVVITGIELKNNVAKNNGGGVYFTGEGKFTLGAKGQNAYHFIFNNFIGESIESFTVDSNGDLIGANESNLHIDTATFNPIILKVNFAEGSKVGLTSGLLDEELLIAKLDGEDAVLNDYTIESFVYDNNSNFKTYSQAIFEDTTKTGVGLYIKDITVGSGQISYTADDTLAEYDGTPHTINVKVNNVENYEIWYSTSENGVYSKTPVTVTEPGDSKEVWFYITADGYSDTVKERRIVTVDKLELFITRSDFLFSFYLGQRIAKEQDVSYFVKGTVYDINGNAVAYKAISAVNVNITNNNNTSIALYFEPINTGKYKTLENVSIPAEVRYENLYMKDNYYYIDEALTDSWKVAVSEFSVTEVIPYIVDGGTLYMLVTGNIIASITLTTNKTLYISRMSGFTNAEMFNVSTGSLTIGSQDMAGKIIIDGKNLDSTKPLITVSANGKLTIQGNVVIQNAKNTTSNGGAIVNLGETTINGLTIKNCMSPLSGGAIYTSNKLTANNLTIESCQANSGGAIWVRGTATISNSLITKNTAAKLGSATNAFAGGIFVTGNGTVVTISDTEISGNKNTNEVNGSYGGGLVVEAAANVTTNNVNIVGNSAYIGGGIYVKGAKVIATKTFVNENFVKDRGIIYLTETDTLLELVSGSIDSNTASKTVSAVYLGSFAKFVFGTDDSYLSTINNNMLISSSSNRATAVYLAGSAIFEMYSGVIGSHYETDTTEATIYVRSKSQIKLYGGELSKNQKISKTPIVTEDDCAIYLSGNFKYDGKYTVESPNDISRAAIYLIDNLAQVESLTLTISGTISTQNQPFVMADTTVFEPTWEEWNEIFSKTAIQNIPAGYTATKDFVFDYIHSIYTLYLNSVVSSSNKFYFDPTKGVSGNSNSGITAAQAVGTWDKVLEITNPGDTVYLIKTWEIGANTTIIGDGLKLTRYYESSSNFLNTSMIKLISGDITLTINNLILDGNKTKNGTVTNPDDYLLVSGAIIENVTNKPNTIDLFSVSITNNATTNSYGSGIRINYSNTSADTVTVKMAACKVIGNYIRNLSYYAHGAGIGIYISGNSQVRINLQVSGSEFNENYIKGYGHSTHSGGSAIGFFHWSNISSIYYWDVTLEGCKFNENVYETTMTNSVCGSVLAFRGYNSTHVDAQNTETFNLVVKNCDFNFNRMITNQSSTSENGTIGVIYEIGKINAKIENCNFMNTRSNGSDVQIQATDGGLIDIENCKFENSFANYHSMYIVGNVNYALTVFVKNCKIEANTYYGLYLSNVGDSYVEDFVQYGSVTGIYFSSTKASIDLKDIKITSMTSYAIQIDSFVDAKIENVEIDTTGSYAIYFSSSSYGQNVKIKDVSIKNAVSSAIYFYSHSTVTRNIVFENITITDCYSYGIYSNHTNIEKRERFIATNVLIQNCYDNGVYLRNVDFIGNNVTINNVFNKGVVLIGSCLVSGLTIYECGYGISRETCSSSLLQNSISNCTIYNYSSYGLYMSPLAGIVNVDNVNINDGAIAIYVSNEVSTTIDWNFTFKNCTLDGNRDGIYIDFSGRSIGSNNYGQNSATFENIQIINNIRYGIFLALYFYNTSEGNLTSYDFNFKNCLVDGGVYGVYTYYYKYYTNPLQAINVNFDTNTTIQNCKYGFMFGAYSTTEEARVFTINGGNFINNEIGAYTEGRLNIAGNAVIKDNNVADFSYGQLYIYDNAVIGNVVVYANSKKVYLDASATSTEKIELKLQGAATINGVLVEKSGTWTAANWSSNRGGGRFTCNAVELTIDSSAFTVKIASIKNSNATGAIFFDPANRTLKANDSNDGLTINTPLKTWAKVLQKTTVDSTIYLISNFEIYTGYDFQNRTLTYYVDPSNNNLLGSYRIVLKSSVTLSNLKIDGNMTKNGTSSYKEMIESGYWSQYNGIETTILIENLTVTLDNIYITNVWSTNAAIRVKNSKVTIKNSEFERNNSHNFDYSVVRAETNSTLVVENCEVNEAKSFLLFDNTSTVTVKDSNFYDVYGYTIYNYNTGTPTTRTITVENCDFIRELNTLSGNAIYARRGAVVNISDCEVVNYNTAFVMYSQSESLQVNINDVSFENLTGTAIHFESTSINATVENVKITRAYIGINWYSCTDLNLTVDNIEISFCRYAIG
ncbi:MAG: right-handed parallel beta-helix repeat-containing protein, partial [Clostridia bacterium]|nr:right-handed parallel beta-helix repeat-containing protein [Clostridia bacterium]